MELQLFHNPQFGDVRMSSDGKGNPLFLATDVAKALGYSNPRDAVAKHCKSDGVAICDVIDSLGRQQQARFITEGNLYRLIIRSNLPEAEKFESWIFDEVVPAIRKTGGYIQAKPEDTPEEIMARALVIANNTLELQKQKLQMLEGKTALLEQENHELAPKAEYTDKVLQAPSTHTIKEMAKELNFRSWNAFVDALKKDGIMYRDAGGRYLLYAKYAEKNYTTTRTAHYDTYNGVNASTYTVWTEEGRRFLHEHFDVALQPAVQEPIELLIPEM